MTPEQVVRAAFAAYHDQDRAAAEALYAESFVFTSPQDDHIDRATWFARCFPTAGRFAAHDLEHVVDVGGGQVLVTYAYALADGSRWRNAELTHVRDGRITEVQVFFGGRLGGLLPAYAPPVAGAGSSATWSASHGAGATRDADRSAMRPSSGQRRPVLATTAAIGGTNSATSSTAIRAPVHGSTKKPRITSTSHGPMIIRYTLRRRSIASSRRSRSVRCRTSGTAPKRSRRKRRTASSLTAGGRPTPSVRWAAVTTTAKRTLSVLAGLLVVVAGLLVARGITHHDGPVLPLAFCRAGQPIAYLPPLDVRRAVRSWQADAVYDVAAGLALLGYAVGAVVYRRRTGSRWPVARVASWLFGLLLLVIATSSAMAVYDMTLFGAHMLQHLLLIMVIPAFLVLGRPLTLAMALSPSTRSVAQHRAWHYVFSAPTALALYTVVLVGSHLTGVMADVMRHPWAGQLEHAVYLLAGTVFFAAAVGNAPVRWRLSYPGRLFMVMAAMVVDAFVGIVLLQSTTPIATLAHPGWGPSLISDTHIGGALMWVVGDGLMAVVPVCVYLAWARVSDQRVETAGWFERARVGLAVSRDTATSHAGYDDTGYDDDDAQLDAYNRWLASLDKR